MGLDVASAKTDRWRNFEILVRDAAVGKRLPTAVYVHRSLLAELPQQLRAAAFEQMEQTRETDAWSVVKFSSQRPSLSLLDYPGFDEEAFPRLLRSVTVDLVSGESRNRRYAQDDGAFILHRKELLVGPDYVLREEFELITREAEEAGLFESTNDIGRLGTWKQRLAAGGYQLVDGRMLRADLFTGPTSWQAQRGRTALSRPSASLALQSMQRQGWLDGALSVLDYGCGRGDDLRFLAEAGVPAWGWDPAHHPKGAKDAADLVNLGYVINVIEDADERLYVAESAFKLARKALVVSAMIAPPSQFERFLPFRDGVVTSRGTFQKYFTQTELKEFVERAARREALGLAPGVVVAFRDAKFQEAFLDSRFRRRGTVLIGRARSRSRVDRSKSSQLHREHRELCDAFWAAALELGRWPEADELGRSSELIEVFETTRRAAHAVQRFYDPKQMEAAAQSRREDLLVEEAAATLAGCNRKFGTFSARKQRDIRHFYGSYRALQDELRTMLRAVADPAALEAAAAAAHRGQCGGFWDGRGVTYEGRCVERLPTLLRCYIELGGAYHGGLHGIDLIRVHLESGKLTLASYDDFYGKALPLLKVRTKVDLRRQRIDDFEYGKGFSAPPLFWKSRLLAEDAPHFAKQQRFDERLDDLGLAPEGDPRFGFSAAVVDEILTAKGLEIRGFRFFRTR